MSLHRGATTRPARAAASRLGTAAALAIAALSLPARAIDLADGKLTIDGAGGAAYSITSHNDLATGALEADPNGTFKNIELNLTIGVRPWERVAIHSQLFFDQIGAAASGVDWSFIEYTFSEKLRIRAGKIKLPLGISSEVEGVGTLRPFYSLPASVYGPTGIASEAYFGAGVTGDFSTSSGWTLGYDLFGGDMSVETSEPFARLRSAPVPGTVTEPFDEEVRKMVGARFTLGLPIDGLFLRVSGYRGDLPDSATLVVALASVEYQTERWLVRAEGFRADEGDITHGGYAEVAFHFTPEIQLALQVEGLRTRAPGVAPNSPFLTHRSVSVGLNYWFSPGLVVKAAAQAISGNRLAFPRLLDDALLGGGVSGDTALFTLGTQFSF